MPARRIRWFTTLRRWLATVVVLAVTAVAVALIWQYYVTAPWTRDGRVRVLVANVAPQVSGQIVELRMADNQVVHKGDVLYVIDPFDFKVKLDSAQSQVKMRAADLQVKRTQAERRQALSINAASVEEKQQYVGTSTMAEAQFADAQIQLAQAEVNLKRTEVRSPVDGFVTNLQLRVGDYASTGSANVSVVDMHSFWVDGYFEETKLAHICVGDEATVDLMGFAQPVIGRVESIGRGISVSDAAASTQGLPNVDPVYTWVRLAQRVPVRIQLVSVPEGSPAGERADGDGPHPRARPRRARLAKLRGRTRTRAGILPPASRRAAALRAARQRARRCPHQAADRHGGAPARALADQPGPDAGDERGSQKGGRCGRGDQGAVARRVFRCEPCWRRRA